MTFETLEKSEYGFSIYLMVEKNILPARNKIRAEYM